MLFRVPDESNANWERMKAFIETNVTPNLSRWYRESAIPRRLFQELGKEGWLGYDVKQGRWAETGALKPAVQFETLGRVAPGIGVAVLVQVSLGMYPIRMFGSEHHKQETLNSAALGRTLICLGNSEINAGSDAAAISMTASPAGGGWILNGSKAYVTNGSISDLVIVTAVSDPGERKNHRISMFLVDLAHQGISRRRLNKQVWIPSDLTRIQFDDVRVPEESLLGVRGNGLPQVLQTFTCSRIPLAALTVGAAAGAFESALYHAGRRKVFGKRILDFQSKGFEAADLYAGIEAARLMVWHACRRKDLGKPFRMESSMAKYLAVEISRKVSVWAADLFGAASVVFEHPIHKYPMDAWASSLGEGTQDIQKLIIFREILAQSES